MEKYNLSKMSDEEIQNLFESVDLDEYERSGDEEDYGDDESMDEDDAPFISTSVIKEAITTSLAEIVEEPEAALSVCEPGPSSKVICRKHTSTKQKRKLVSSSESEEGETLEMPTSGIFVGDPSKISTNSNEFKKITWKKQNLQLRKGEITFTGNKELPEEMKSLKTPYEFFMYFFSEKLIQEIAMQSNLYAHQKNIGSKFSVSSDEFKKFIGILIFMSVYRYPNIRSYWGKFSFEEIREAMNRHRFEEIRSNLHFRDTSNVPKKGESGYDALYRVRPLIDHFNERFGSVAMLLRLCVDEQMCSTKMTGTSIRQYMPNKPHKWGFKFFVLCDSTGFSYAFEIYTGAGDNKVLENAPDLGASSNVVVRLTTNVPSNVNHIVYFDNFYTSLPLLVYLRSRGIFALGTIRANRIPNCKLSDDSKINKMSISRGFTEKYVGKSHGIDISTVLWHDTKNVRLASTYVGVKQFVSKKAPSKIHIERWDKMKKTVVNIPCPNVILEYNKHMGGVDLMDGLIGRYHVRAKTWKWTTTIFYHLLDVAVVNAYILYHRVHAKEKIELPVFRTMVAESLCRRTTLKRSVGRPRSETPPQSKKPKRSYTPQEDLRYDKIDHWCIFRDRTGKKQCKNPGCTSETQAFCTKCKLSLCNSTAKSCFYDFHHPKN